MRIQSKPVVDLFLISTQVVILITFVAKVITLIQHPKVLDLPDSVTTVKFGHLFVYSCIFEMLTLAFIWRVTSSVFRLLTVLYFSLIVGSYRILAHMVGQNWCPCLGNFANWASLRQDQVDIILNATDVYLLVGSLTLLTILFFEKRTGI